MPNQIRSENVSESPVGKTELRDIISRLSFRGKTGKQEYIKILELLDKNEIEFIDELTTIRNRIVHKIENVNFDLKDYIKEYDENQLKKYARIFILSEPQWNQQKKIAMLKDFPREMLSISTITILSSIYKERIAAISKHELAQKGIELIEILKEHRGKERT